MTDNAWSIVLPPSGNLTNIITNPSVETGISGYTGVGGTRAQSSTQSRRGAYSLAVTPTAGTGDGVYYGNVALTNGQTYTWSFDMYGVNGIAYKAYFATTGAAIKGTATTFTGAGAWQRVTVTWTADATTNFRLYVVKDNSNNTGVFYVDGMLLVNASYDVMYFDGDSPDCYWTGSAHGSTSIRPAQSRGLAGGRVVNLDDYGVFVRASVGTGMPFAKHNTLETPLLDGAIFRGRKVSPRTIQLIMDVPGTSRENLHALRQALIDAIKPDLVKDDQPFWLKYCTENSTNPLYIQVTYDSGLDGAQADGHNERLSLRVIAYDPLWREDGEDASILTVEQTFTPTGQAGCMRRNGQWENIAGNNYLRCLALAPDGSIYAGGNFTSIGGVACNRIAKYTPSTGVWSALGTGLNNVCWSIAVAADGTVYAGGEFTTAGGTTVNYIAKWNGSAWSAMGVTGVAGAGAKVSAVLIGPDGNVYVSGTFATAGGVTVNNVAYWNGSAWNAMGSVPGLSTAMSDQAALGMDDSGRIFVAGTTNDLGTPGAWNISTLAWETGGAVSSDAFVSMSGVMYSCSTDAVYRFTGTGWKEIGNPQFSDAVDALAGNPDTGEMVAGGVFYGMNGVNALGNGLAYWTGSDWVHTDARFDSLGAGSPLAILYDRQGSIYVGAGSSALDSAAYLNTVTNSGTSKAYPKFTFKRSGGTAPWLLWIRNETTGATLYCNYKLQDGETLTIDLTPGAREVKSSLFGDVWRAILRPSNVADFHLLPGTNYISVLVNASTGVTGYMTWANTHHSADGTA